MYDVGPDFGIHRKMYCAFTAFNVNPIFGVVQQTLEYSHDLPSSRLRISSLMSYQVTVINPSLTNSPPSAHQSTLLISFSVVFHILINTDDHERTNPLLFVPFR